MTRGGASLQKGARPGFSFQQKSGTAKHNMFGHTTHKFGPANFFLYFFLDNKSILSYLSSLGLATSATTP